jgi:dTDP-4-dehydrorhamnose reductase
VKILLLGKNGQLGWELQRTLAPIGPLTAIDYEELDLQDFHALRRTLSELRPELIVNAAAYTNVDKAESETEKAHAINATVPGILAEEAAKLKAALIHYSTDYVFDGTKGSPYREVDEPNPLSAYGKSKLAGEKAIQAVSGVFLILRTAWVYSLRGASFVNKVLEWSRQHETLRIVDDQISNPTWARMLAEVTAQLLAKSNESLREHGGLYHLAGGGFTSRLEWARKILQLDPNGQEQKVKEMLPATTAAFPTPAARPLFSALDCSKFEETFGTRLPNWQLQLQLAMS